MKDKNYIVYDWQVVKEAFNRLAKIEHPRYTKRYPEGDFLKDVYESKLPLGMFKLFARYFIINMDRNNSDVQILINAQKQLDAEGFIGKD